MADRGWMGCVLYLAVTGALGFLLGRVFPKTWLYFDRGLFRCFAFEKNGRIYEKLGIRFWQNRVPDMSRILPTLIPAKNLKGEYAPRLPDMILETCIAELIHWLLSLGGLYCLRIWPGWGGAIITLVDVVLLNLPFILIQRYNRPRLIRLMRRRHPLGGEGEKNPCMC